MAVQEYGNFSKPAPGLKHQLLNIGKKPSVAAHMSSFSRRSSVTLQIDSHHGHPVTCKKTGEITIPVYVVAQSGQDGDDSLW